MLSTPEKSRDLEKQLAEKEDEIVKLQSQSKQLQLDIEVIKKTAEEDKQRLETVHLSQMREQQRKFDEELNELKLQLQRATTSATKAKSDSDSEIQTLTNKLNEERDQHTQDVSKLMTIMKEVEKLREEKRSLSANLAVVQNFSDKVCFSCLTILFIIYFLKNIF